jgi:hypothetical protein
MFEQQDPATKRSVYAPGLAREERGPLGIVVDNLDWPGQRREPPNVGSADLLLRRWLACTRLSLL